MKKKKIKKEYISAAMVCVIVNELLWILDPEDGGILFGNLKLKIWIALAIMSFAIISFYLLKLRKSQDRDLFVLTYDYFFALGSIIFITSIINIIQRLFIK